MLANHKPMCATLNGFCRTAENMKLREVTGMRDPGRVGVRERG